jgi:putative ABC transport system permease protein
MDYKEVAFEALAALKVNRLRTGLAILGVVIGIGSVIALVSLGQGSQKTIEAQIQSLGSNLLTISPRGRSVSGVQGAGGTGTSLTLEDALAITASGEITAVKEVSPEYSSRAQIVAGRNNTNTQVIGVYPQYAQIRKIQVGKGRFISQRDVESMSKIAVIGPQTKTDLFGENADPLGREIRIKGLSFKIIGETVAKGGQGFNNPDDAIYIPLSTAQKQLFGADHLTGIVVEAKSEDMMTQAQNEIGYLLLERHKLKDPQDADFAIFSQADVLSTASSVTGTFTALLTGIAAISLLVGGIGIMNIMLVTVTERTREIGLRKALGAKRKVVIFQFLFEAALLTLTGGVIGILLGILVSYFLSRAMNFPFVVSGWAIVLSFGVSGLVGIIFGLYPAQKAASLEPIEALRYE